MTGYSDSSSSSWAAAPKTKKKKEWPPAAWEAEVKIRGIWKSIPGNKYSLSVSGPRAESSVRERWRASNSFTLGYEFVSEDGGANRAVETLNLWLDEGNGVDEGTAYRIVSKRPGLVIYQREVSAMHCGDIHPDIAKPLNIDRQKLIDRLNERLAEEQQKRQDAEDAAKAKRQQLVDAVGTLDDDQIANLLDYFVRNQDIGRGGQYADLADWITRYVVGEKKFVSEEKQPTVVESELEKFVRVLDMSGDATVEVQPTSDIYPLL